MVGGRLDIPFISLSNTNLCSVPLSSSVDDKYLISLIYESNDMWKPTLLAGEHCPYYLSKVEKGESYYVDSNVEILDGLDFDGWL